MKAFPTFVVMAASLAACQSIGSPEDDADACNASSYNGMVGTSIAAVTLPSDLNHRIIGPDTAVTFDYVPERLNFHVDRAGKILEITCG